MPNFKYDLLIPRYNYDTGFYIPVFASPTVTLTPGNDRSTAFFLRWTSNGFTEGIMSLQTIKYLFTSTFTGCSFWFRIANGNLYVRHESLMNQDAKHISDGYTLVYNSINDEISMKIVGDPDEPMGKQSRMGYVTCYIEAFRVVFVIHNVGMFEQYENTQTGPKVVNKAHQILSEKVLEFPIQQVLRLRGG